MTPSQLLSKLSGELLNISASPGFFMAENNELTHVISPESLSEPRDFTQGVLLLMHKKWVKAATEIQAGAYVCDQKIWSQLSLKQQNALLSQGPVIQVKNARKAFVALLNLFHAVAVPTGIHATACVESEHVDPTTSVGAFGYIEVGATVGAHCQIGERVVIKSGVHIGEHVIIHAGTVIGCDGYGFYREDNTHHKIPQVGGVCIEDYVEIGANVTIDKGTLGDTVIGEGTKIDNLVQIGHNVRIGKRCLIVAQVGISGSTVIGDDVVLAGQTGVAGHLKLGDGVIASGKTGITRSVPAGMHVSGYPAMPHREFLKLWARLKRSKS